MQLFSLLEKLIFRYISNQRFFVMSFWYNDEKMIDVIVDTKWRVSFSNKTKFQSIKLETFDKIKIIWTQLDNIDIIGQYWHNETISTKLDNMDIINFRNKNRNLWFFFFHWKKIIKLWKNRQNIGCIVVIFLNKNKI